MSGSRVVVTGAASGIGRAIAVATASRGDQVYAVDLHGERAEATATAIGAAGSSACDVSVPEAVESMAAQAVTVLGGVDLVFHAAGVAGGAPVLDGTADGDRWVIDVNLLGTIYVSRAFGSRMVIQGTPSRIVLVGSEHSVGVPHLQAAAYTASKHGVLGFADVFRRELPEHVRVSVVCPGLVATEMWRSGTHRGEAYGGPQPEPEGVAREQAEAMLAAGMSPEEVAQAALRAVDNDEFLIFTHAHVRRFARERFMTIMGAFDRQAPDEGDDRYEVSKVVRRLRTE